MMGSTAREPAPDGCVPWPSVGARLCDKGPQGSHTHTLSHNTASEAASDPVRRALTECLFGCTKKSVVIQSFAVLFLLPRNRNIVQGRRLASWTGRRQTNKSSASIVIEPHGQAHSTSTPPSNIPSAATIAPMNAPADSLPPNIRPKTLGSGYHHSVPTAHAATLWPASEPRRGGLDFSHESMWVGWVRRPARTGY
jgi:hypothetical protein